MSTVFRNAELPVGADSRQCIASAPAHTKRSGASVAYVRRLAHLTESRKDERRLLAIRKAWDDIGHCFQVDGILGEGGYGVVFSAMHKTTGQRVAVKRVAPFEHPLLAVRTMRELRLLRFFNEHSQCENIIRLLDIVVPGDRFSYQDVYLVQELMESDLYRVMHTQALTYDHAQYFTYQILRGLKTIHAAGVLHRDIKPSNLLVNSNCDLKICDFGLARDLCPSEKNISETQLTEYVATRWYRAPEIMLSSRSYTKAVDIWSVGCTLFEMLSGKPLFPGKDYHNQLCLILEVLGTPSIQEMVPYCAPRAIDYVRMLPFAPGRTWDKLLGNTKSDALNFLSRTVTMDPSKRMTVEQCLEHPFVAPYHDKSDEPGAPPLDPAAFTFAMNNGRSSEAHRQDLWNDVQSFVAPLPRA